MKGTKIQLEMTRQSNNEGYIRVSTQHSIHQASNNVRIWHTRHLLLLLKGLQTILKSKVMIFFNWSPYEFRIVYLVSF